MDHYLTELLEKKSQLEKEIRALQTDLYLLGVDIGYRRKEEELREKYNVSDVAAI